MTSKIHERVIKPPIRSISTGKLFRPSNKFLYKILTTNIMVAIFIWAVITFSFFGIMYIVFISESGLYAYFSYFQIYFLSVSYYATLINLIWLIPSFLITPIYVRRIEYSVIAETGESMPEIYVKKGLVNITRKHVPFRTITNISSRAGPFDRIFGIGSVEIETAGFHNPNQLGPEIKLEGITFYEEVRDYILSQLRRYTTAYTLTTEPKETPLDPEDINAMILSTLKEIRDLLKQKSS